MPAPENHQKPRDERVDEALADIHQALDAGEEPDPGEWLRRYPDVADDLAAHFANEDWFRERSGVGSPKPEDVAEETTVGYEPGSGADQPDSTPPGRPDAVPNFVGYEQVTPLAEGGYGAVYKAWQTSPPRWVAIKILRRDRRPTERDQALFRGEVERQASLDHPNLLTIYEAGEVDGWPFFTMKLTEGGTLAQHWGRYAREPREAARLMAVIARTVHHAHQRGLLHRDLKPGNILLDADGVPFVADFGLSRLLDEDDPLAQPGAIEGTAPYMAPEQARGDRSLMRETDVYGLGAILYALLTGEPPFRGTSLLDTLRKVKEDRPASVRKLNPRVDRDLEAICLKCLKKEPPDRYDSAADLADDLERWLDGKPVLARPLRRPVRFWRLCRRHPALALLTALTILLVGATVGSFLHGYRETQRALGVSRREHYRSLVREVKALRLAQIAGYRDAVWDRLREARRIDTPLHDLGELRLEAVACMGDFLGPEPLTWDDFSSPLLSIALHPDGRTIALGFRDGTVRLRGVPAGEREASAPGVTLTGHRAGVSFLAFDPVGGTLVSADVRGNVQVWEAGEEWTAKHVQPFSASPADASVALAPGGSHLAVCPFDKEEITIWDVGAGHQVGAVDLPGRHARDMAWHPGAPLVAFRPDGGLLVAAYQAEGKYRLAAYAADPPGQGKKWKAAGGASPDRGHVHSLAFRPDGAMLFVGCGQGFLKYETAAFRQELFVPGDIPASLAVSPDHRLLALTSAQLGVARLWDLGSPQAGLTDLHHPAPPGKAGDPPQVHSVAFSRDGSLLVSAGEDSVRLWRIRGGLREARILAGHPQGIPGVAFSPQGDLLASAGKDQTVRFWDTQTGESLGVLEGFRDAVQTVAFGPDGDLLAAGDFAGDVHLYRVVREQAAVKADRLLYLPLNKGEIWSVAFGPEGKRFAAGGEGGLWLWEVAGGGAPGGLELRPPGRLSSKFVRHLQFGPEGKWLAWAETAKGDVSEPGEVFLADLGKPGAEPERIGTLLGSELSLGFRADPSGHPQLAFVEESWLGKLTALTGERATQSLRPSRHARLSLGPIVAVSPDGRYLASARQRSVSLWDLATREGLFALPDAGATVWGLAWGPDGQLAVGTSAGGLTVWRLPAIREHLKDLDLDWEDGS